MTIRKAVIPAAGFGTRFLPATKSQPKEMLPIVDTPVIQYVVEELVAAGVTDILMVIGKGKRAIEEHFDRSLQLEQRLSATGREGQLADMRRISEMADIHFVWQRETRGLGDAVYCARHHIGDEPFLVCLGDTVIDSHEPAASQVLRVFERFGEPVVLLERVPRHMVSRYGIMDGNEIDPGLFLVDDFVEKPETDKAPSELAIASRYAFTAEIFDHLENLETGSGGEVQLTDAMRKMVRGRAMYGLLLEGKRYDIGNREGFVQANIEFALKHADMAQEMKTYLKAMVSEF